MTEDCSVSKAQSEGAKDSKKKSKERERRKSIIQAVSDFFHKKKESSRSPSPVANNQAPKEKFPRLRFSKHKDKGKVSYIFCLFHRLWVWIISLIERSCSTWSVLKKIEKNRKIGVSRQKLQCFLRVPIFLYFILFFSHLLKSLYALQQSADMCQVGVAPFLPFFYTSLNFPFTLHRDFKGFK